MGIRDSVVSI